MSMETLKSLFLALLTLALLSSLACNQIILARLSGTIGAGTGAFLTDTGFDTFTSSTTGTGDSTVLRIRFSNSAGEYFEFELKPASQGSSLSQMYPSGTYFVDGEENQLTGSIFDGTSMQAITAPEGQLELETIAFSSTQVASIQGSYTANLSEGGSINGSFVYQEQSGS